MLMSGAFFLYKNKFCQKYVINTPPACDSPCCQMYELGPRSVLEADVMTELKVYFLCRLQSVD